MVLTKSMNISQSKPVRAPATTFNISKRQKKQPNNLVYIINLLIFANRTVEGNAIAKSSFHFLRPSMVYFITQIVQRFKTPNYGKDYDCNDGSLFLYNTHGCPNL